MEEPKIKFHKHLDECEQCRNRPFGLCKEGQKILKEEIEEYERGN